MAKKVILGTDIARDAFKIKVNDNFTELYDKDVALGAQINTLDANKASKTQPAWITPTLQNGWNVNTAVGYRKNEFGQLEFKGSIFNLGSKALDLPILTLPVDYRPNSSYASLALSYITTDIQTCNLLIKPTGELVLTLKIPLDYISLDNIRFNLS